MPSGNFFQRLVTNAFTESNNTKTLCGFSFHFKYNCDILVQTEFQGIFSSFYSAAPRKEKIISERQVSHEALYLSR